MMIRSRSRSSLICWFFCLLHQQPAEAEPLLQLFSSVRTLPTALLKDSIPVAALSRRRHRHASSFSEDGNKATLVSSIKSRLPAALSSIKSRLRTTGYFYGLEEGMVVRSRQSRQQHRPETESMDILMNHALEELRGMRQEMTALRKDLKSMKKQLGHEDDEEEEEGIFDRPASFLARIQKQREWDKVGLEIEQWAEKLLFEEGSQEEQDGWKEVKCSKLCSQYNKDGNIKCYLKWMKDSRGERAVKDDEEEYACIKLFATLDAPMEHVCEYLAEEGSLPDYNDVVVKHEDLEEIAPHSKICWGQSPKILFIKPRDFVTFCHHRWLRDGTQVVVNQAVDHDEYADALKDSKALKAHAIRGANFISPDPDDPNKTRFSLVTHANPGPDVSPWMARVAVNNLVPIEPFKLFHKINKFVQSYELDPNRTQMVNSSPGRSNRPGGLSQMGYACFWPKGGGLKEGLMHGQHPDQVDPATVQPKMEIKSEYEDAVESPKIISEEPQIMPEEPQVTPVESQHVDMEPPNAESDFQQEMEQPNVESDFQQEMEQQFYVESLVES